MNSIAENDFAVCYVMGAFRSGTTLLGGLLSTGRSAIDVGETSEIWRYYQQPGWLCSCGEELRRCEFWQEVIGRVRLEPTEVRQFTNWYYLRRLRVRQLPALINRKKDSADNRFEEICRLLFGAIKRTSGCRIIVDSSKTPSYAVAYEKALQEPFYAIHIHRDPRAVVTSYESQKYHRTSEEKVEMQRARALVASGRWLALNLGCELAKAKLKCPTAKVKYEDLCQAPRQSLARAYAELGVGQMDYDALSEEGTFQRGYSHSPVGNPDRNNRGLEQIRCDDRWSRLMPSWKKALVLGATLPLSYQYGYRRVADKCVGRKN